MPWTPARVAISTATSINISSLPAWVPGLGEYADISLTTAQATSGVNPCPANNCPYTMNEGQSAIWRDWNGAVFVPTFGTLGSMLLHGGGHWGYSGNEVIRYDIATRVWSRLNTPANYGFNKDGWVPFNKAPTSVVNSYGSFPDGTPNPLHYYNGIEYVPPDAGGGTLGTIVFMHRMNSNSTVTDPQWWKFDIATLTWSHGPTCIKAASGPSANGNQYVGLAYDSKRKGIWRVDVNADINSNGFSFYSLVTGQQYDVPLNSGNSFSLGRLGSGALSYNEARDLLIVQRESSGVQSLAYVDLSNYVLGVGFAPAAAMTQTGSAPPNLYGGSYGSHVEYCSYDGNFYLVGWPNSSTLYRLTVPAVLSNAWNWTALPLTPKSGTSSLAFESPARSADNHLFTRFRYIPGIKSFLWTDGIDLMVQAGRPSNFV